MKKIACIFSFICIVSLFGLKNVYAENDYAFEGDLHFNNPYLFVSLGNTCWIAQALRGKAHLLRDAAFPFDWLLTPDTNKLIQCLDEKFEHFHNAKHFVREKTHLTNTRYNFKFTHDWPYESSSVTHERHLGQLEFIRKKYTRRITRFNNIKHFEGKVFFMRFFPYNDSAKAQDVRALHKALKRFFPDLHFMLIIVSRINDTLLDLGTTEGIKEYQIKNFTDWSEYETIFTELLSLVEM